MTPDSERARALAGPLVAAALTQLACAITLGGRLHPDEVHQYLEPAHRWVWGYGNRAHEWHSGMRSVLAPGAVAAVFHTAQALGVDDPAVYVGAVHAIMGALSLSAVVSCYDAVRARSDPSRATAAAWVLALWTPWQNLAFRTLGEAMSALCLLGALRAYERAPRRDAAAGLWIGAAIVVRYPSGIFALVFATAYALRRDWRGLARWTLGCAVALAALGVSDQLAWGAPFHSALAYLDYNLLRDRARLDFGGRPVWFYVPCLAALAPAALLACAFTRRALRVGAMPLAVSLGYLAVMSLIAHKEPRFVLPLIPCAVAFAAPWLPSDGRRRALVLALCGAQSLAALAVYHRSGVCEGGSIRAAHWLYATPGVTSVTLVGVAHPGYAHLHRDVPIYDEPSGDVGRALRRLDARAHSRGSFAIVRVDRARAPMIARGWSEQRRFGDVLVMSSNRSSAPR